MQNQNNSLFIEEVTRIQVKWPGARSHGVGGNMYPVREGSSLVFWGAQQGLILKLLGVGPDFQCECLSELLSHIK